ncbi:MAG: tRNA (adenosine(37)-N6)-threonylcarbamoyltransferase complex transferase subunit TsaD [Verrucomicrobia bacterium 13_1_40CM_4_54_4]|nr:MAG: tRNA (adenosine(37)-N6)-threonylcarbamoyltransferase complex transferase subunit TsaD [Verrucomicrobia bacterium 13_1_40CM_4_54_4]PYJ50439.1 MAG: tRNA (adenosine(37)-N6)-threonylcarbamoyltransferase complex transferase subunit TsaD [Verrucomicrobiota bacterium]
MTVLALETSCDETAVAILRGRDRHSGPPIGRTRPAASSELLASEVASQIAAHAKYGGIVPEIASRNHLVYAPQLLERAVRDAKIDMPEVDAFAATSGPGLASSLMIGASVAKGLAIGFGKPYLAINHLEGHLLSPFFGDGELKPNVSLIVSGGHTMSIRVHGLGNYQLIGRTVDDAAGEAFDKVAKMLGLGYPGGPEIEKRARAGDPGRFDLPRSMVDSENFSFSGLKTAVRYLLPKLHGDFLADLCASFQQAVVEVLVRKTIAAAQKYDGDLVTMSGGVSCNAELRRQLDDACAGEGFEFKNAEPWLCTDNAAMIAFVALLRLQAGFESKLTEEIDPNLALVQLNR